MVYLLLLSGCAFEDAEIHFLKILFCLKYSVCRKMFGGFGSINQQPQQQPLFGLNASSAPATMTQPNLFGSQPAIQSQPGALNLFGSSTPSSQPTSQLQTGALNLFGPSTPSSQPTSQSQPGALNLFGSGMATSQIPLFGQTTAPMR
jgi:hypothetical protein